MIALAACGPSSGEDETGNSTGSSSSMAADEASSSLDEADSTDTNASAESSSGGTETTSGDESSAGTTGDFPLCDCAADEVCVETGTDGCIEPHSPNLSCVPLPEACVGRALACDTECGWELCAGPRCSGAGEVCGEVSAEFVCGGFDITCNLFTQDCNEGEKCASWDHDGDGELSSTRCAPIAKAPVPIGGACVWEGTHLSGIDDCEPGAMCLSDDPAPTMGICRAACVGNPFDASCTDPEMQCVLEDWYFGWCLPAAR
jgi:hypothetical protein